jgi:hypothetical protein
MRLVPEGWSHFYKATIDTCKLTDLVCNTGEMTEVVRRASKWWQSADAERRQRMFGAIHWYCFSGAYEHQFERFAALYTVLDTLHWVHLRQTGAKTSKHAEIPLTLAKAYGMQVPSWAEISKGTCSLALLRNEFIHEARFGGVPIGFAHPTGISSINLELSAFLTRLIMAVLGIQCRYSESPVTTRQMHGLDLL